MRRAVIDVGSNSVLLVVAEKEEGRWRAVLETSEVTGLGEGTKRTGVLGPESIERTLIALRNALEKAAESGAEDVAAAGTMALRIAANAEEFLSMARDCGIEVKVLPGDEEARLGFAAVARDPVFEGHSLISVVDVGGHSTEMATGHASSLRFRRSFPIGTLGLLDGALSESRIDEMDLLRASREIDDRIGLCYLPGTAGMVVAVGATATNLVSIREQMEDWNPELVHGARLQYEEISRMAGWLARMTLEERAKLVGLEPGRERTIHAGALILERFLNTLKVEGCTVSVRGWRHAMLEEL